MTKSDLISLLSEKYSHLGSRDVEMAIKGLIDHMARTLSTGDRIEVRGFGSFTLRHRPPRIGRNPKTGTTVELESKFTPHFKPGKELRERVNDSRDRISIKPQ